MHRERPYPRDVTVCDRHTFHYSRSVETCCSDDIGNQYWQTGHLPTTLRERFIPQQYSRRSKCHLQQGVTEGRRWRTGITLIGVIITEAGEENALLHARTPVNRVKRKHLSDQYVWAFKTIQALLEEVRMLILAVGWIGLSFGARSRDEGKSNEQQSIASEEKHRTFHLHGRSSY